MKENDQLILTGVGPDQVGLVERISRFIHSRNCNIEDSKMAVFCGEFAVIVLISGEEAALSRLEREFREMETQTGLSLSVKRAATRAAAGAFKPYRLVASCMDHPGVVYRISEILSSLGINIESMETSTYAAPLSATPLFQLEAGISVPAGVGVNQLRARFEDLEREQDIDIELTAVKP